MPHVLLILLHLLSKLGKLLRPGGAKSLVAENILLKQQLLILRRSRRRAPNLRSVDRVLFGFCSQFLSPRRALAHRHHPQACHPAALSSWFAESARSQRALTATDPSHL